MIADGISRAERVREHADWHAGRVPADLKSKYRPHTHEPKGEK